MTSKEFFSKSFLIFIILGLFTRFYNLTNRLYFIWDNGRDIIAIEKIVFGDLALIGPTSGIQGFFIGPAWYYLGSIGYLIGKGSPWVLGYWYILITAISLPIFWILSRSIFKDKHWSLLSAFLLAFIPGSIHWSSFPWSPMITIPLMAGAYLSLLKSRKSRVFLSLSFFLMALALQFEFAYAIFFVFSIFLLIPWIRNKFDLKDYLYSGLAIGITLVPQIVFEIRNRFIMTQSLLKALLDKSKSVSWAELWSTRPNQLIKSSKMLLFGESFLADILIIISILTIIYGLYLIFSKKLKPKETYKWQISFLLLIIPYFFFMFWRGNHGYFFDYYLTSQFVFIIPCLILVFQKITKAILIKIIFAFFIFGILFSSLKYMNNNLIYIENNAGMEIMSSAIEQLYAWQNEDDIKQGVFRIFTPNRETEHYDYLIHWHAKKNNLPIPFTERSEQDKNWYILIEPDKQLPAEYRFNPWYQEATAAGQLVREKEIGDLKLETWKSN